MRIASSPRLLQVGREVREAKLKDFITEAITARAANPTADKEVNFTVVARAPDSPVVRALQAAADDLKSNRVSVRALFLNVDGLFDDKYKPSLLDVIDVDLRLLHDVRFAAAHEQLVLGPATIWLGDCMRRDPAKRDALEFFHSDNEIAAHHASVSFERLWNSARTVQRMSDLMPGFVAATHGQRSAGNRASSRR